MKSIGQIHSGAEWINIEPSKRSGGSKYKLKKSQEFVIGGYMMGGNPALIVGCHDGGKLRYVGKISAGFVSHIRCAVSTDVRLVSDLPEKRRTFYSLIRDKMQKCQWLKPLLKLKSIFSNGRLTISCRTQVLPGSEDKSQRQ